LLTITDIIKISSWKRQRRTTGN